MSHAEEPGWKQRALAAEKALELLEEEVHERTRAIRTILDNVTFGFLLVDRQLQVCPGFTASCWTLFGRMFTPGDKLTELIEMDRRTSATLELLVDQVFEDILPERACLEQLPQRFELESRVLQLEAKAIRNEEGTVEQLLFTVSDITALENARRESRHNQALITILSRRSAFARFVSDARVALDEAERSEDQSLRRQQIHTVKGNCMSWGLERISTLIDEIEDHDFVYVADIERIHIAFEEYLDTHHAVVGLRYRDSHSNTLSIDIGKFRHLRRLIEDLAPSLPEQELRSWAESVALVPAEEMLGPLEVFTERLANRLGKDVELRVSGKDTLVDPELLAPVLRNLTHLIRNALDHGIEPPAARGTKRRRGLIEVRVSSTPHSFDVEVSDDGRGVDIARLSEKAVSLGLVTKANIDAWSDQQKLELVFYDGLSSATETTVISGRGVGMAAIRAAARRRAGEVRISSLLGEGTSIVVHIPKASLHRQAV